jgi:hypothetical protein
MQNNLKIIFVKLYFVCYILSRVHKALSPYFFYYFSEFNLKQIEMGKFFLRKISKAKLGREQPEPTLILPFRPRGPTAAHIAHPATTLPSNHSLP